MAFLELRGSTESNVTSKRRIGMLLTADTSSDREIWEWCPENVVPFITRLQIALTGHEEPLTIDEMTAGREVVQSATRSFLSTRNLPSVDPEIVVFNCTSASFCDGLQAEAAIRSSILAAGAPRALTTSGAVVGALTALGARRIAVGTPYSAELNPLLKRFLTDAGFEVTSIKNTAVRYLVGTSDEQIRAIAAAAFDRNASAMFISCAALRARHLLPELSAQYGMPVITSLQATMWAALAQLGERVAGPDHILNSLPWPERLPLADVTP
ncbi:hypothetical protein [Mesorhizobium sp.]|uniref:maleate cis-trans isomerase family protein n=1 Tax=Mesorhizobium sp. TaxID=1871066 RepID=UPI001208900F|nr:hypothetical protein [Mesorhizobium sp.]TIO74084.1 MAG: hypothetical protein E5X75_25365 [Mesorhizobium sp.]